MQGRRQVSCIGPLGLSLNSGFAVCCRIAKPMHAFCSGDAYLTDFLMLAASESRRYLVAVSGFGNA